MERFSTDCSVILKKKKKATDSLKDHTEKNVRGPSQAWHGDQE